jgi:glutathione S-transferase
MDPARLITIPISHYCEKARWMLDASGVPYREEPHAPIVHRRATRAVGGKSVPILVHGTKVIRDSSAIALHVDALTPPERRLVPAEAEERARVLAIEDDLDETLGVDARLLGYWYLLRRDEPARAVVGRLLRIRSPLARRLVTPVFRTFMFRFYKVSAHSAQRAEARVRATFARLGEAIEREGYLVARRFTLADLTFAALASPLLSPPEHPVTGRFVEKPVPELAAFRAELAATSAGRHALRVYREHRGCPAALTVQ